VLTEQCILIRSVAAVVTMITGLSQQDTVFTGASAVKLHVRIALPHYYTHSKLVKLMDCA